MGKKIRTGLKKWGGWVGGVVEEETRQGKAGGEE